MNRNDILTLNIDSNAFAAMKEDFNKVLRRTLSNMQTKESDEATLTLKLNIRLTEMVVPDYSSHDTFATRTIHNPRFDHKINSVMQIKTEESGSLKGEYELVWDEDEQDFVMRPIDNGQRTLFDDDVPYTAYTEVVEADVVESTAPALPAAKAMLEAPADDTGDGYDYDEPEEA